MLKIFDNKFFQQVVLGNTLEQWILTSLFIVATILGAFIITWLLKKWLSRLIKHLEPEGQSKIIHSVSKPLVMVMMLMGFRASLNALNLSSFVSSSVNSLYHVSITLTIAWMIVRVYNAVHEGYLVRLFKRKEGLDTQLLPILKVVVKLFAWVFAVIIGLSNAGYNIGAILASLGIGGIAFALAAKDAIANIFGGITIFIQRPFQVGERIVVGKVDGWVDEIGLRSSVITNFWGERITIPNKTFTDGIVKNMDARGRYFINCTIRLRYDTTHQQLETAMKILKEIPAEFDVTEKNTWTTYSIGDYSHDIDYWYAVKVWKPEDAATVGKEFDKYSLGKTQVNMEILKRFEAHNIKMAMPVELKIEKEVQDPNLFL
ncbi:mechanosensitive ion channel domain-containing protein [uncultured Microscilla sp.]|uniref:mechanosensitive ion channel family protein n=1 Tax=uncultured Microscilla sp. TaxID=432653 RepID=UPI00260F45B6|nr:mechanosensitive ion channel domain-containing protein [uncultured Microscilla sp.]